MGRKCIEITNEIMATTEEKYASKSNFNRLVHNGRNIEPYDPNKTQNIYGIDDWDLLSIPQNLTYTHRLIFFNNGDYFVKAIFKSDDGFNGRLIIVPTDNKELLGKTNFDIYVDELLRINIKRFYPSYNTYNIRFNADGNYVEIIPYLNNQCYFCGGPTYGATSFKYFNRHICADCAEEIWEAVERSKNK